jgi:hypothetical protein
MSWKVWFYLAVYQYLIVWIDWEGDVEGSHGVFSCFLPCLRKSERFLLTCSTGVGQFSLILALFAPIIQGRFHLGFRGVRAVVG